MNDASLSRSITNPKFGSCSKGGLGCSTFFYAWKPAFLKHNTSTPADIELWITLHVSHGRFVATNEPWSRAAPTISCWSRAWSSFCTLPFRYFLQLVSSYRFNLCMMASTFCGMFRQQSQMLGSFSGLRAIASAQRSLITRSTPSSNAGCKCNYGLLNKAELLAVVCVNS